jgi:hypothetical protein
MIKDYLLNMSVIVIISYKLGPAQPAALATNPFTRSIRKIYIKISKLLKSALIFDATLVALGVCVPKVAKIFGYK